jgi:hypothetical protein
VPRSGRIIAAVPLLLSAFLTSGCTEAIPTVPADDGWSSRMTSLLSDPRGAGGAGGVLQALEAAPEGSDDSGSSVVVLGSVPGGSYDVLGVCREAAIVHLTLSATGAEESGGEADRVLVESDIACGATTRLPVTSPGGDVTISAYGPVGAGWKASLVSSGWEPAPRSFG